MKLWVSSLLGATIAGPALALSCLPPDVATSFNEAAASDEEFVLVHGTLSFESETPPGSALPESEPKTVQLPARLNGQALSSSGFDAEFSQDVTLELACFGSWCGSAEDGQEYLAFLSRDGSDHLMVVDPCYTWVFPDPTHDQLEQVISCAQGTCPSDAE